MKVKERKPQKPLKVTTIPGLHTGNISGATGVEACYEVKMKEQRSHQ